jgi:hypothetical protein
MDDETDVLWRIWTAVNHQDTDAAISLLRDYVELTNEGKPIPKHLQRHIAICFSRILTGLPPKSSLFLSRGRGRPKEYLGRLRNMVLGGEVARLRESGLTHQEAILRVAETYEVSEKTVERGFARYKPQWESRKKDGVLFDQSGFGASREAFDKLKEAEPRIRQDVRRKMTS